MVEKERIKVTIVNRNYPPLLGITGDSAAELARYLQEKSIDVTIVHIEANYKGGVSNNRPSGKIYSIPTFYNGKKNFLRLFSSLLEGYRLIRKAKTIKSDLIICMTDPPLINFWAALLYRNRQKWFYWAMDLYPEAFISGKLISRNNVVHQWIEKIINKYPPNHFIALGRHQSNYLDKKFNHQVSGTLLPCGIFEDSRNAKDSFARPTWASHTNKILLGYCGNLGEAHSIEFLFSVIRQLDASKFHLILAVYGSKAKQLIDLAKNKTGVEIIDKVARKDLNLIDIHLTTLEPAWVNVCVPSKTVSSVCSGSTFLYYGIEESDNWELLQRAGWRVYSDEDVKNFLRSIDMDAVNIKKKQAAELAKQLLLLKNAAFHSIYSEVVKCVAKIE